MKYLITVLFILFGCHSLFAQSGEWVWVGGDSLPDQAAIYGTKYLFSSSSKPPATYEGTEWKDIHGKFWFYDNSDLWQYDPSINEWAWFGGARGAITAPVYGKMGVADSTNYPGLRYHAAASWVDSSDNLWLFGSDREKDGYGNDLWKYNISSKEWTWIKGDSLINPPPRFGTKGLASTNTNPGGVYETDAAWVDSNNLWLFGGFGSDSLGNYGNWNDLWKYNIPTNEWTWVSGDNYLNAPAIYGVKGVANSANKPSGRYVYTRWIQGDTLWLFGGETNAGKLNDLWKFSIPKNEWTWVSGTDTIENHGKYVEKCVPNKEHYPYARNETRACWKDLNGNFWLYGGQQSSGSLGDMWVYNPKTNEWTWVFGDSIPSQTFPVYGTKGVADTLNNPYGKNGAVCWIDSVGNLWMFGGQNGPPFSDIWKYSIDENCNGIIPGTTSGIEELISAESVEIVPNPVKYNATVKINLKESTHVVIMLFDLEGREMAQLYDGNIESGSFEINFDLTKYHLSSSMYFVSVQFNDESVAKKLITIN